MTIQHITDLLEKTAPLSLQEDYDNAGLLTGNKNWECSGILVSLDATEDVIKEAIDKKCNLVVAHHPIVFRGLKKINGKNYVEQTVITAIKNDIAIYAIHTNLDNVIAGVNGKIADAIGLINRNILAPKKGLLQKLAVFVPVDYKEKLLNAVFEAGAGTIGNYSECSFGTEGTGTFKAGDKARPFSGTIGERHQENEVKVEVIFPAWLAGRVVSAMKAAHPYEEVAYDLYGLANEFAQTGSGLIGELETPVKEADFLENLKKTFGIPVIRHTAFTGRPVKKVAICGGAGSFLTQTAKAAGADVYVTADIKYHEFFDAERGLLLADIGHYESEQFTIALLFDILRENFPNFAVLKTGVNTNPVRYS
ncbi:MAG: Nif3-like dinuclear metal center hexameric protein [Bacteroidetes bacterium]|jgi:dinuclear metal center YbgI/SA1388 family protein|nr:Nif3-like dinuclear metal center hexameric protein [Bacteroidota bacterium]